jgi:hypothetical protein
VALSGTMSEVELSHDRWSILRISQERKIYLVDFPETRRHIAYTIPLNVLLQIIDRERKYIFDDE